MKDQTDLFEAVTFAKEHPIKFARVEAKPSEEFKPIILAEAPADVVAMPEGDLEQKIAKVVAVLKWAMARYEICFSYSGGKDSGTVLSLALAAAAQLKAEGAVVRRFLVLNSDTLIENPEVIQVVRAELLRIKAWIAKKGLPGEVEVTQPGLLDQWAVSIIGGQTLLSTPMTNRNCTTDLKTVPLTRARSRLLGRNNVAAGKFTVGVTGVRFAESGERASNMAKRAESATQVVQTNSKQDVFLAPIADWTTDDVMEYIGLAVNNLLPVEIYSDFEDVWRIYKDAEGECTVGRGDKPSKGCSARHGCFVCSMVQSDKSMDAFLVNPQYAYMEPLARFREYLNNTLFDLDKRYWIGRSIVNGHVEYAPMVYSPAYVQDLLRFALTLDKDEREAAADLGIQPRFQIVSLEALVSIDAVWSLHAYAHPFAALKIFHEVNVEGKRFEVPVVPKAKPMPMPKARFIPVEDWDEDAPDSFSGLRNAVLELEDGPCSATRQVPSKGAVRIVMEAQNSEMFSVDSESVAMLMLFELDELVRRHDRSVARPVDSGVLSHVGAAYKFYVQFGTISVAKSYMGTADQLLRRATWRARNGLAGFNFSHDRALALSVEKPVVKPGPTPEELQAKANAEKVLMRKAARMEVQERRISMRELMQDWSPAVPWRRVMQEGLRKRKLPAHCLYPKDKAYNPGRLKGWSIRHFVRLGELVSFLKDRPDIAEHVKVHRSVKRRRGAQLNLFAA